MSSRSSSSFTEPCTYLPVSPFRSSLEGDARSTYRKELVVLSLTMVILTFHRVRSLARTACFVELMPFSLMRSFRAIMTLFPASSTLNSVDSPSMRHTRARGESLDIGASSVRKGERKGVWRWATSDQRSINKHQPQHSGIW